MFIWSCRISTHTPDLILSVKRSRNAKVRWLKQSLLVDNALVNWFMRPSFMCRGGDIIFFMLPMLYFDLRPSPKILFQGDTPEGSDTFQWPVIERDRVGGLRLMIRDKVKVSLCHYSDAPEESNLWTAWQLFPLDDD